MRRICLKLVRVLAIMVVALGVVAMVIGGVFLTEGIAKNKLIVDRMNVEKVTLASGAFMVITGLALGGVSLALYRIGRTSP